MNKEYKEYRERYLNGINLNLDSPVDVSLELSSTCNMACGYCYHAEPKTLPFKRGNMSLSTATRIIDQAQELGVNSLKLNYRGESTINPMFSVITRYAADRANGGVFIDRLSNSNFKFVTRRDDILEGFCNLTKVKVSMDSFNKEVFETQRANGQHDVTLRNIDDFYNHKNRKETRIVIQAVRTKLNRDEDIEGESNRRWPEAEISIRDMVGGRNSSDLDDVANRVRDVSSRQSCLQAHVRLIFDHEGTARPCCPDIADQLLMGNIWDMSISDIFNSQFAKNLRKSLKNKEAFNFDPCKNCSSFETYKGYAPSWES